MAIICKSFHLFFYRYQIFGDVFEEAVRTGLPAVQTQHPGFYYQQAAQYAVLRRKTALQVCNVSVISITNREIWYIFVE